MHFFTTATLFLSAALCLSALPLTPRSGKIRPRSLDRTTVEGRAAWADKTLEILREKQPQEALDALREAEQADIIANFPYEPIASDMAYLLTAKFIHPFDPWKVDGAPSKRTYDAFTKYTPEEQRSAMRDIIRVGHLSQEQRSHLGTKQFATKKMAVGGACISDADSDSDTENDNDNDCDPYDVYPPTEREIIDAFNNLTTGSFNLDLAARQFFRTRWTSAQRDALAKFDALTKGSMPTRMTKMDAKAFKKLPAEMQKDIFLISRFQTLRVDEAIRNAEDAL